MRKPIRTNVRKSNEENNSENISKSKKINNRKFTNIKKDNSK